MWFKVLNLILQVSKTLPFDRVFDVDLTRVVLCVCRTNSDSALHTSVMNPPPGDLFTAGLSLAAQGRLTGQWL